MLDFFPLPKQSTNTIVLVIFIIKLMRCANFICALALICHSKLARVALVVGFRCLVWMHWNSSLQRVLFTVLFWPHRILFQCWCLFIHVRHCMLSVTLNFIIWVFFSFWACHHKLLFQMVLKQNCNKTTSHTHMESIKWTCTHPLRIEWNSE